MSQSDTFLPFAKPCFDAATIAEVVACLESGWITTGPRVKQFEADLKAYFKSPHALTLISATAGLHLVLSYFNFQPGDEVITTPMTFAATLNMITSTGAKPVLVDIDPGNYNLDVTRVAAAITPRTRAIIPVHFAGLPVDLDPLFDLAKQHGLHIIEDAAQAIGAQYKGQTIGGFGETQIFSFHPNKVITTGEGGCVTTRDDALARHISLQRFHGIDRDAFNRNTKEGSDHYDVVVPGYKYNMMDIQAALGLHQLPQLDNFVAKRTILAKRYLERFADWKELSLPTTPHYDHRHAWYIFTPLINPEAAGMTRNAFIQRMKEQNIGVGLHYTAAHLYSYYQRTLGHKLGDFPQAETVGDRIVSLPLFPQMTFEEQDRVIDTMARLFNRKN